MLGLVVPAALPYLPGNAGIAILQVTPGLLPPWVGLSLYAMYAATALVAGATVLVRRDARRGRPGGSTAMTASTSTRHAPSAAAAHRGLAIYLANVVVLSAPLEAGISSRAPSTTPPDPSPGCPRSCWS